MDNNRPLAERFAARFVRGGDDECWLWTGSKSLRGYGYIRNNKKAIRAHRLAWMMAHGSIPDGLLVCHKCDMPACVNPHHLFLGTSLENNHDMVSKGRLKVSNGEKHGSAKLTADTVISLRCGKYKGVKEIRALAARLGLSESALWKAKSGETWKSLFALLEPRQ